MGKYTQIVVRSRDQNDFGFPKKLGVYQIGEARRIGHYFNLPVLVLRENDVHVPRPAVQLQAGSPEAAREMAISHYKEFAASMKLDISITEVGDEQGG